MIEYDAGFAGAVKQFRNRVDGIASNADYSSLGHALNKHVQDLDAGMLGKLSHAAYGADLLKFFKDPCQFKSGVRTRPFRWSDVFSLKLFSGYGHTFPWPPAPDPWASGYSGPDNRQPNASFMLRGK